MFDCDVLIVGGGPVGLFLAAELGRYGIDVQVFDARPGTVRHPAANANSARTMEHFRRIGIADEVRAAGLPGDYSPDIAYFTSISQYELARLSQPSSSEAVQWARQHDFTWPTAEPPHRCSQLYVESILLKAALQHRCCNVNFSAVVESFKQGEQGVTAIVKLEQTAHRQAQQCKVRARYLVGCDGPRSSVRKALGIRYNGVTGEKRGFMGGQMEAVYFHAPTLYAASHKRPAWQYWTFSPTQRALLIAVDGRGDFIMNVQRQDEQPLDPALMRERIANAIGADIPFEIKSTSSWTAGFALVAERLSLGRVFLAGDSAHLFTPTGGLGYNTGIDDAANLAWKLAALVDGSGGAALVESYHAERHPAALRNTAFAREFADSIGHVQLPTAAFEEGPQGDAARQAAGRYLDFHAYHEFMIPGVHLGTRYEQSPLLVAEAGSPGPDSANLYLPCARPGHRAPHVWLRDGRSLYALFGRGYTLLSLNADNAISVDPALLARQLPGLTCVTVAGDAVRELYQADFVLIRPDQHVAWRGNVLDDSFAAVAARALGQEPAPARLTEPDKASGLQIWTLVLCFMVVACDGFDLAAVGYVAPLLKQAWALTPAQLGPIFGAGLFGLTIGSFVFGPLADRIGRKRVIVMSMLVFGVGTLACAHAGSADTLVLLRLLTGIGLGGAMPTAITLSSEFSPERNRALLVTLMFCGFTLGLACGGALAALLIPSYGWQGVFVFGGIVPLVLTPVIWIFLPESLRFMAGKKKFEAESRKVLERLTGDPHASLAEVIPDERRKAGDKKDSIVATLFSHHYRAGTMLLWLTFFCTLWVYYQISSWLPTVITEGGIAVTQAATIGAMMPVGGTIGSLINARLMDRHNPFIVLSFSYLIAVIAIVCIGPAVHHAGWLYLTVFCTGFGLSGAQTGANVLVSGFYSTVARATGVSWALAVGRIGSIIGSMTGGVLLAALPSVQMAFLVFAVPALIAGLSMLAAGRLYHGRAKSA